jgi:hypothetical protein
VGGLGAKSYDRNTACSSINNSILSSSMYSSYLGGFVGASEPRANQRTNVIGEVFFLSRDVCALFGENQTLIAHCNATVQEHYNVDTLACKSESRDHIFDC